MEDERVDPSVRDYLLKEAKMWSILRTIFLLILDVSLVFFVAYSNKNTHSFHYQNKIKNMMTSEFESVFLKKELS
jgi:hypothetical protein